MTTVCGRTTIGCKTVSGPSQLDDQLAVRGVATVGSARRGHHELDPVGEAQRARATRIPQRRPRTPAYAAGQSRRGDVAAALAATSSALIEGPSSRRDHRALTKRLEGQLRAHCGLCLSSIAAVQPCAPFVLINVRGEASRRWDSPRPRGWRRCSWRKGVRD